MSKNAQYQPATSGRTSGREEKMFWRFKVEVLEDLSKTLLEELRAFNTDHAIDVGRGIDFYGEVHRFECDLIARALRHVRGNQRKAARLLGLKATTLNAKLKHYGMSAMEISSLADEPVPPGEPASLDAPDLADGGEAQHGDTTGQETRTEAGGQGPGAGREVAGNTADQETKDEPASFVG